MTLLLLLLFIVVLEVAATDALFLLARWSLLLVIDIAVAIDAFCFQLRCCCLVGC